MTRWPCRLLPIALLVPSVLAASGVPRGAELERMRASLREADRALAQGRTDHAAELYRQVRDAASASGVPSLPLARALDGLADVHRLSGRLHDAVPLYVRSAELWETLLGRRQPRLATTLHNLGVVYLELERFELAGATLQRALDIWESTLGAESPQARTARRALRQAARRSTPELLNAPSTRPGC